MKYALFHVMPKIDKDGFVESVSEFEEDIRKKGMLVSGCNKLLPGLYECQLDGGVSGLMWLVLLAQNRRLQTRVLFLDSEPSWVVTPCPVKKEPEY